MDHVIISISDVLILTLALTFSPLPMSLFSAFFPELSGCQSTSLIYPFTQQSHLFLICGPQVQFFVDDRFNALDQFNIVLRDECY